MSICPGDTRLPNQFNLDGMAVFVTGAANGMGAAVSRVLHEAGASVVLAGRDLVALDEVASGLPGSWVVPCDVTEEASVAGAVATALERFPTHPWGLANVAGGTGPGGKTVWEHSLREVEEIFAVNVYGPFLTMKHFLPVMIAARTGAVVNVGGTFGFKGAALSSAYGATKWALRGFTHSAALEAGPHGVRVNSVNPGGVDGPRLRRQLAEAAERTGEPYQKIYDDFAARSALGRMSSDVDVANAVLFLLSDAAGNITGQDLLVDGGTVV
jgi:NAD(P)-dependent dehydrogenase (short-subunit alcohol dehydrogenase family)